MTFPYRRAELPNQEDLLRSSLAEMQKIKDGSRKEPLEILMNHKKVKGVELVTQENVKRVQRLLRQTWFKTYPELFPASLELKAKLLQRRPPQKQI